MDGDGLVLIGPTVVLRVPGEADVGPLWDAVVETMGELRQWMSWFHDGYSETDVRADKLGAVREGVARNRFWLGGAVHDAVVFSLVPADLGLPVAIAGEGRDEGVSVPV